MTIKWASVSAIQKILKREQGTITKDWGGKLAVALAYPNRYQVAMSSLGFQSVYAMLNRLNDVVCERVVYGAPGLSRHEATVLSLESQRPVEDFTVIAFSLSFEMDYLNVVDMLLSLGIPLSSSQRDDMSPLLIAGGPAITTNPLPLCSILDAAVIGEGEIVVAQLAQVVVETISEGREATLRALADIPGVYVPSLHGPTDDAPDMQVIQRQWVHDLDSHPVHSVVLSPDTEFGDMYLIEIARGCARNCPFCLAGHTYKPHREHHLEDILAQAQEGLNYRQRIGLVSAAVSDYSRIDELAISLRQMGARLSVSSLRVRPISETLIRALSESGNQTLTIAPEAGSQRLRQLIQKGVREEDLFHATELAQKYDFRQLKLYFMTGLPTETEEDVLEIAHLAESLGKYFSRQIIVNVTPFVPKAHTPFEREAMCPESEIQARFKLLRGRLQSKRISVRYDSAKAATVQGVLARGDRDVSLALEKLTGPTIRDWQHAIRTVGLDPESYLAKRLPDEPLPWQNIAIV